MLKKILTITGTKTLSKTDQTEISGGRATDPISGGGGGGGNGGGDPMPCFCLTSRGAIQVPCNSTCADGSQPICP